ncbi:MAG: DUF1580 domain-containing protein [Planctomycetes bacterium]|nr:DUF1580 domain-containing protein [Planctomycetota bacterium]
MDADDPLITLTAATRLKWLPCRRRAKRPSLSTLLRWILHGVGGKRLAACRVGGTWCTTERSLREFFAVVASDSVPSPVSVPVADARTAMRRAEAILVAAGVR